MIRFFLVLIFALCLGPDSLVAARLLSPTAKITVWTVGPGKELYAAFGHTALRITDPEAGFDRLYNFGTFDFNTPHFYLKFIQGDLDYFLTVAVAPEVLQDYQRTGQLVIEQTLDLTPGEADALLVSLETNLRPENAAYRYDFVRDNCTTRIRDAVEKIAPVTWPATPSSKTLREMVQPYVADRPAIQTGINLLFGSTMDHEASAREAHFLPEDMKLALDDAVVKTETGTRPLVNKTETLVPGPTLPVPQLNWFIPFSYALAALGGLAAWKNWRWFHSFDYLLFGLAALVGCLLLFFWVGTRHWVLHANWNLIWALPTHLVIWFLPSFIRQAYWTLFTILMLVVTLVTPIPAMGFCALLAVRALALATAERGSIGVRSTELPAAQ